MMKCLWLKNTNMEERSVEVHLRTWNSYLINVPLQEEEIRGKGSILYNNHSAQSMNWCSSHFLKKRTTARCSVSRLQSLFAGRTAYWRNSLHICLACSRAIQELLDPVFGEHYSLHLDNDLFGIMYQGEPKTYIRKILYVAFQTIAQSHIYLIKYFNGFW